MNYDQYIHEIIEVLKADKSIPAEYRNAVISSGRRWQCEIRGAKTMTYLPSSTATHDSPELLAGSKMVDNALSDDGFSNPNVAKCNCPSGGKRRTCPVHGEGSTNGGCICTELGRRKDCPVHGEKV